MAKDGRIEPGDMILQVNDINFENMTNDEAVSLISALFIDVLLCLSLML